MNERGRQLWDAWIASARDVFAEETENCVPSEQMQRYILRLAPPEEKEAVALHLAFCGHCQRAYAANKVFSIAEIQAQVAQGQGAAKETWERLKQWLNGVLRPPALEVVPAGTAGATVVEAFSVDAQGVITGQTVSLTVKRPPGVQAGRFVFRAVIADPTYEGASVEVSLRSNDVQVKLAAARVKDQHIEVDVKVEDLLPNKPIDLGLLHITLLNQ